MSKTLSINADTKAAISFMESRKGGFNSSEFFRDSVQEAAAAAGWRATGAVPVAADSELDTNPDSDDDVEFI